MAKQVERGGGLRYSVREVAIAVVAGVLLLGIAGTGTYLVRRDRGCDGRPVSVAVPEKTGPRLQTSVTVRCEPAAGLRYVLVVELVNTGRDRPHSEYYPSLDLVLDREGSYTETRELADSAVGSERDVYVVAADAGQFAELGRPDPSTGVLLRLPAGVQPVSARVRTLRTF